MQRPVPSLEARRRKALARRLIELADGVAQGRVGWRAASAVLERVDGFLDGVRRGCANFVLEDLADAVRAQLTTPDQIDLIIGEFQVTVSSVPPPIPLARRTPPVVRRNPPQDDAHEPTEGPNSGVFLVGEVDHGQRRHSPLPPPPLAPELWRRVSKG